MRVEEWFRVQAEWRDAMFQFVGGGMTPEVALSMVENEAAEMGVQFSDSQRDFLVVSVGG